VFIAQRLALLLGAILVVIGLGITSLVCFSGKWGIMHGWPLLLLSVPALLLGIGLLWYVIASEKRVAKLRNEI
jgi:hypothetical protein